jgi:hypothetical protein
MRQALRMDEVKGDALDDLSISADTGDYQHITTSLELHYCPFCGTMLRTHTYL